MTKKQQMERENLEWFNVDLFARFPPTETEFEEYLSHSERGIPIKGFQHGLSKFNVYSEAKRWRGIIIHELWEDSFYAQDGSWLGFVNILKEEDGTRIPEHIAYFISREIFAGQDKEKIIEVYKSIK